MQKLLSLCAFLMALAILGTTGLSIWGVSAYTAYGPLTEPRTLVIARGQGVNAIAQSLADEGVIRQPLVFRVAARLTENHQALKAGEYEFPAQASMKTVMEMIAAGDVVRRHLTIREGLTSWQVVQIVNDADHLTGTVTDIPAEGSLLPETYQFTSGDDRAAAIAHMQKSMADTLAELWPQRADDLPFTTQEEAVILASIVEKETGVAGERAKIAGVFENRLRLNMPLQTDPTVIYALTDGKVQDDGQGPLGRRLLTKDLAYDSPYNTYKYPGLPPGPICNPGRAALEAVLNPEKHDYLYFVADGTGGHAFAKTLAEHNSNVAKWRKIRREQSR